MPRFPLAFIPLTLALLLAVVMRPVAAQQPGVEKPAAEQLEFFEKNIRPLFVTHCHKCHSRSSKPLKGGLLLDHREGMVKGGDSGPVIVAGKPGESEIHMRIMLPDSDDDRMPPKGNRVSKPVADLIKRWIEQGAKQK